MHNRTLAFLMFFSVFLAVYGSANVYIIRRGYQALPDMTRLKRAYLVMTVFLAGAYILGRMLESWAPGFMSSLLTWAGSFWLGIMSYLFLVLVLIDITRLLNAFFRFFPLSWSADPGRTRLVTAAVVLSAVLCAQVYGFFNAMHVRVKKLDLAIPAGASRMKTLKAVFVSDIHLGTVVGSGRLRDIVDTINARQADIVLFGGDIVDGGIHPERHADFYTTLKTVNAPLGAYAITGNHEYIAGIQKSVSFITDCGITLLRDRAVKVADSFILAGREDSSAAQFTGLKRLGLAEILKDRDFTLPVICMDHSPFHLEEASENGVALQLSGHTHSGQLWPFNYITGMIFELDWGYMRKGDTQYYVSCGAGLWGPPVRIGNRPEVVVLNIIFN